LISLHIIKYIYIYICN